MNKTTRAISYIFVVLTIIASQAYADKVILQNGAVFEGKIIAETPKYIEIRIGKDEGNSSIIMKFGIERIEKIIRDNFPPHSATKITPLPADNEKSSITKQPLETIFEEDNDNTDKDAISWNPKIDKLISDLNTSNPKKIQKTVSAILTFGKEASPPLVLTLKSGSIFQKKQVAYILGKLKEKKAVEALITCLGYPYSIPSVSRQASLSLRMITGKNMMFKHDVSKLKRQKYIKKWKKWFDKVKETSAYKEQLKMTKEEDEKKEVKSESNK